MIPGLWFPSSNLQHIVAYYFHQTGSFDNASFENLYSTPLLECLAFNFNTGRTSQKMYYGGKTVELQGHAHLFGQPTSPVNMAGKYEEFIVVKFRPMGIWQLTGISMHHIANTALHAEDLFGKPLMFLVEQMHEMVTTPEKVACLDRFLQEQLQRKKQRNLHACMPQSLTLLAQHVGNISMGDLQQQTHTTRKTLERAFVTYLGVSPKLYARIVRYNFAKSHIEKTGRIDWAKIVDQHGYYDQAHFINEFKCFSGKTPLAYYKDRIAIANDLSVLLNPAQSLKDC